MANVKPDFLWDPASDTWLRDMGLILAWSAVYILATWGLLLDKLSPRRHT